MVIKNISLNLLPPEVLREQLKSKKFYQIQLLGTSVILSLVFLSSLTFALGILQSRNIKQVQASLSEAESKVSNYKEVEAKLTIVKNRLNIISQFSDLPSKQRESYEAIVNALPDSVVVSSFSITPSASILITMVTQSSTAIDALFGNILSGEEKYQFIKKVSIESLNRGRDGLYRATLKFEVR